MPSNALETAQMTPNRIGLKNQSATAIDPLSLTIRAACEAAVKGVLNIVTDISPRRLLSVEETATYLCLSEREIYNMLSKSGINRCAPRLAIAPRHLRPAAVDRGQ